MEQVARFSRRFFWSQSSALLGAFALLTLPLASLGIYGVLSNAVTERTYQIGAPLPRSYSSPSANERWH
jgi:hypothetical protein